MINKKKSCLNIHSTCSNFLSYYYGNSNSFSLFHIQMMEKFYKYFPIYIDSMSHINWNSYLELLQLGREECYFYYSILVFCGDDLLEMRKLINSNIYSRI